MSQEIEQGDGLQKYLKLMKFGMKKERMRIRNMDICKLTYEEISNHSLPFVECVAYII